MRVKRPPRGRRCRPPPAACSEERCLNTFGQLFRVTTFGESQGALEALLPELPLAWIEFKVGQMGVFVADRHDLVSHHARIKALADAREAATAQAPAQAAVGGLF